MRVLRVSPAAISEALSVLARGGVVIHATETCYGIACDLANPAAVRKLFAVKNRPENQPVSALFSSVEAAAAFIDLSPRALALAKKHLPGPLTLVLPRKAPASLWVTVSGNGKDPMVGVRISSHPLAMELAQKFGKPIATTSANLHGEANPYSVADLEAQFSSATTQPDLILDGGSLPVTPPSTVVEIKNGEIRVLREGNISIHQM